MGGGGGAGIAIIVTSSRLQETLRVEPCVELELSLPESDLEPSLLTSSAPAPDHSLSSSTQDSTPRVSWSLELVTITAMPLTHPPPPENFLSKGSTINSLIHFYKRCVLVQSSSVWHSTVSTEQSNQSSFSLNIPVFSRHEWCSPAKIDAKLETPMKLK